MRSQHAHSQGHQLGEIEDGQPVRYVALLLYLFLTNIQVQMAEGAGDGYGLGAHRFGILQQTPAQLSDYLRPGYG